MRCKCENGFALPALVESDKTSRTCRLLRFKTNRFAILHIASTLVTINNVRFPSSIDFLPKQPQDLSLYFVFPHFSFFFLLENVSPKPRISDLSVGLLAPGFLQTLGEEPLSEGLGSKARDLVAVAEHLARRDDAFLARR